MPKLPDSTSLGEPESLHVRNPVVTANELDGGAIGRGAQALATGGEAFGSAISGYADQQQKQQDALELLKADVAHKQGLMGIQDKYENDPDYATAPDRFNAESNAMVPDIAAGISNPAARERFQLRAGLENAAAGNRIQHISSGLDKQQKGLDLESQLQGYVGIYQNPSADDATREATLTNIDHAIQIGQQSRIINPIQANKLRQQYVYNTVRDEFAQRLSGETETPVSVGGRRKASGPIGFSLPQAGGTPSDGSSPDSSGPLPDEATPVQSEAYAPDGSKIVQPLSPSGAAAKPNQPVSTEAIANVSTQLETGSKDPLKGISNISRDTNGSKSYGNFGLNSQSGASAWDFKKDYGDQFGLTANPGSKAFDDQWKAAAASDPQALRTAELSWYKGNVLDPVSGDLTKAGIPAEVAQDPRVQAYFADRVVQQGPASITNDKHASRISDAFANSGGDPVSFIQSMTAADGTRQALNSDFPSALKSGVYSMDGHQTRLQGRESGALGLMESGNDQSQQQQPTALPKLPGRFGILSDADRQQLMAKVTAAHAEELKQTVADDIERLRYNGSVPTDENGRTSLDLAKQIMKPKAFQDLQYKWNAAQREHSVVTPLQDMSPAEADAHLAKYAPNHNDTSENYKAAHDIQKKGDDEWTRVQESREEDPARAVESAPEVMQAKDARLNPAPIRQLDGSLAPGPHPPAQQANQSLMDARIAAQTRLGIPDYMQSPITKAEAHDILGMQNPSNLTDDQFTQKAYAASDRAEQMFGPKYAQEALKHAFSYLISGETRKQVAADVMAKLARDEALNSSDLHALTQARTLDPLASFVDRPNIRADTSLPLPAAATTLPTVQPNKEQIQFLQQNPQSWQDFDKKFGSGSAARNLGAAPRGKLPEPPSVFQQIRNYTGL